ncbi:MAG: serine hydrolase [Lentimicrobium sp.]|nr:serine hydrolase [Lentimicrobium sp.]
MKVFNKFGLFIIFYTILFNQSYAQSFPDSEKLSQYIDAARITWKVPGLSVGIIYRDSIVLLKGYGEREIESGLAVDENTLFAVASNTKSFTTTALGMLVDEGKLNWDDPVNKYLPWFKLYDPYVTMNFTIRDLLCHRSGLGTFSGDLIWYGSSHSREEIVTRAQFLEPKQGFRAGYGYSNIMYLAAGLVIEAVTGKSWDVFISERILIPLEMTNTNTSTLSLDQHGNTAMPHNDTEEKVIAISYLNWDNIAPAGSINSTSADMLKWIGFQLHKGDYKGQQLIKEKTLNELWTPQTVQKVSAFSERTWPSTHFKSYGLGWSMMDYHGKKIISHSGGYDGMISYSAFVPEAKLGFVILTNKNSGLYLPLAYKIFDTFLSSDTTDWSSYFYELTTKNEEASKKEKMELADAQIKNTTPTLPLIDYCGIYSCKKYGEVKIELIKNQLFIQFVQTPIFYSPLKHWHYNTFSIKFPDVPSLPSGKVAFIVGMDNKVEKLLIDVPNPDFDFTELDLIKIE